MAPPLLRWTLSKVAIGEEEAQRLQQEEQASRSFIKNIHRVLMPTRGGANVQLAAQLVGYLAQQNELEITALYATSNIKPGLKQKTTAAIKDTAFEEAFSAIAETLQLPGKETLQTKVETGNSKVEVILKEASRGYDLIVMGASEQRTRDSLFNLLVDRVVQEAPCATLVVKSNLSDRQGNFRLIDVHPIRHILVPTVGSEYSKNAVEIASTIAAQTGALVTLIHVINLPQVGYALYDHQTLAPAREMAQQIVEHQTEIGRLLGATVECKILEGNSPEKTILTFTRQEQVDLIVLGSSVRLATGRVFFGHRVDAILNRANCPVAVISAT
ncbi:universal stress protein [Kovacikia minuta CCNUW1]|uniref:universal stress protein n=1 Tax=Kovacikia minuta TaxID=2931930 RepID=UPI001CD02719|nr:universal stress protein [Kovacikia minuta]UBF25086.1 universal stress protein [Kovacikia minuta CCNUW1]